MKKLVRYRDPNSELDLFIQERKVGFLNLIPYILSKLYLALPFHKNSETKYREPEWIWGDFTNYANEIYSIDKELNKLSVKVENLLKKRKDAVDRVHVEKKHVKKCTVATRGYSYPFELNINKIGYVGLSLKDSGQEWKKMFKPGGKKSIGGLVTRKDSTELNKPGFDGRTVYSPEENEKFKINIDDYSDSVDADHTVMYKKTNKDKSSFDPTSKKIQKSKGETERGHAARIKAMAGGGFNPDTWTYF